MLGSMGSWVVGGPAWGNCYTIASGFGGCIEIDSGDPSFGFGDSGYLSCMMGNGRAGAVDRVALPISAAYLVALVNNKNFKK